MLYRWRYIPLILVTATVWLLPQGSLRAQVPQLIDNPEFQNDAQAAVDSIYNFNFEASREIFQPWRDQYPDHPIWTLLHGMRFWWKVLSDLEDDSYDEEFFEIMARADYQSNKLLRKDDDHADALIIKAVSNGYISRLYANRGEWLSSINRSRRAFSAYQYLREVRPGLQDLKLGEGIKLYYSDYIPDQYPVVRTVSWALPEGDRKQGLELIRQASENAVFAKAESIYFLGNIYYNYEEDYQKASRYMERLYERYPRNGYFIRSLVKSYYKIDEHERNLEIIDASLARWKEHNLPYEHLMRQELLTFKGRILEKQGEKQQALTAFREAFTSGLELPESEDRSYQVISGYYAGKMLYETGQPSEAEKYLVRVEKMDSAGEYRDRARQLLQQIRTGRTN